MRNTPYPIIGITGNLVPEEKPPFDGAQRAGIIQDYIASISEAGGVPLILPIISDRNAIRRQLEVLDGVLISGGQDVCPKSYNEEPTPWLGTVLHERDAFEFEVIRLAHEMNKPLFGICRGLQIINVAFGGSLYQDIPQQVGGRIGHSQKIQRHEASHTIEILQPSLLHSIIGKSAIETNSFHHQAIKELAPGFKINATAEDGIIEGIERNEHSLIIAVQWHPETMAGTDPDMAKLFKYFIEVTRGSRGDVR